MIYTIILLIIIVILFKIILKTKPDENFINNIYDDDLIYQQYFNPYFIKPTNCMENLTGEIECYDIPKDIWNENWWINIKRLKK